MSCDSQITTSTQTHLVAAWTVQHSNDFLCAYFSGARDSWRSILQKKGVEGTLFCPPTKKSSNVFIKLILHSLLVRRTPKKGGAPLRIDDAYTAKTQKGPGQWFLRLAQRGAPGEAHQVR